MSLGQLMKERKLVILGLNSGTSADGLDMAAIATTRKGQGIDTRFLKGNSKSYPAQLRSRILNLADSKSTTLEEIITVNNAVGDFFGKHAASFIKQLSKSGITVDAVASHGQTVRHVPVAAVNANHARGTFQIGSLEMISFASKKVTVGDFRQADIALGHEGAPITVAAMQRLFASNKESRLIINIGGASNYFYYPLHHKRLRPLAGDCGPGNSLCDILCEKLFHKKFDLNGKIASSGRPSKRILALLLAEAFFRNKTISTGRETFGKNFAEKIISLGNKFRLSQADIIGTAAELTVLAIVNRIKPLVKHDLSLSKLYLSGGGRKNKFFVKRLSEMLKDIEIESADKLGFNADYIEAAAYAVMGEAALRSEPLPTVFDGTEAVMLYPVLGKIVQPPVKIGSHRPL